MALECHDITSIELAEAMSQQATLCHNKDQAELKLEDKTLSQHVTTMSRHKELKMTKKFCRDKRQLCRDTKFRVNNGRQDNFVTTEKFYITKNTT